MKKLSVFLFVITAVFAVFTGCEQNTPGSSGGGDWVATPVPSEPDGHEFPYGGGTVSFTCATEGASIYYTTDSGAPDTLYTGPIAVTQTLRLRVQAKKNGMNDSNILLVTYTVELSLTNIMEFAASMKICWNLGNALDGHIYLMPSDGAWQNNNRQVTRALINAVKAQGFDTVRIPVTWGQRLHTQLQFSVSDPNFTLTVPEIEALTLDPAWLRKVTEVIDWVNGAGMKAIIDIHHDGADSTYWLSVKNEHLSGESKKKIDAIYKTLWRQIAEAFKDKGESLLFEAFNELHDGSWSADNTAQRARVNELCKIFVDTVRAAGGHNTHRYLIISNLVNEANSTLNALVMPEDPTPDRIFVSIHYYIPQNFTLNAATDTWTGTANVISTFNSLKSKFINNGIPVIIGEYGATRQASARGKAYRKYYMEYVTKHAHDCGLIPVYWDNGGAGDGRENFGLFNRASPHELLTDAEDIIAVMMKAVNEDYPLSSITPP